MFFFKINCYKQIQYIHLILTYQSDDTATLVASGTARLTPPKISTKQCEDQSNVD